MHCNANPETTARRAKARSWQVTCECGATSGTRASWDEALRWNCTHTCKTKDKE